MFELFDQFEQDPNATDFSSSCEDNSLRNSDLFGDNSLTQEPFIADAAQTSPSNPNFNPFDTDIYKENDINSGAIEETSTNSFGKFEQNSSAASVVEETSPYNLDRISGADTNHAQADFTPFSQYYQTAVDASATNDSSSSFNDSQDYSEESAQSNGLESQTFTESASTVGYGGSNYEPFLYVDTDSYSSSVYDDTFVFFDDSMYNSDDYVIIYDDWTTMIPVEYQSFIPNSFEDWLTDLWTFFFGDPPVFQTTETTVLQNQFTVTSDGLEFDSKNGLIVDGNVHQDIDFLSQQTHSSCSLMAQEQFVARYFGESIPESILEKLMSSYGVYDPEGGTVYEGQTMVLDTFNIPYERNSFASINDLVSELNSNHDCIIGVDAREFYNDPSIPPDSGHAVTVVGKGIDPVTNEIKGFYITDSNFPGTAHYVDVDTLSNVWYNDIISVPNPA